jgi:TonB family protein
MRFIILILSFLAAQQLLAQNAPLLPEVEPKINDAPEIISYREEMPYIKFEHCTDEHYRVREKCSQAELMKLIYAELKYPEEAKKMGTEGRVFISFVIKADGTASDFKLVKGLSATCDEEALRAAQVVFQQYKWIPGRRGTRDGMKTVDVLYNFPVKFKLK